MCDAITNRCADGNTDNMFTLGLMFATALDPPQLDEARTWLNRADQAGNTAAMINLAALFADKLDPRELDEARTWLNRADQAGHAGDRPREGPR